MKQEESKLKLKIGETIKSEVLASHGNVQLIRQVIVLQKDQKLLTVKEVSELTNLGRNQIINLIKHSKLKSIKQNGRFYIDISSLFDYTIINGKGVSLTKEEIERGKKYSQSEKENLFVRDSVFISYSHEDANWLKKLRVHFSHKLENKIRFWDDTKILPGKKWEEEIINAIHRTKIGILLISANFFKSKFISNIELPMLLDAAEADGALILIIYLRPCFYEEFPEIIKYQGVNSPTEPISGMSEFEMDNVWVSTVKRISQCFNENHD